MTAYLVSLAHHGVKVNILLSGDTSEIEPHLKDSSRKYKRLKNLLVSRKWMPRVATIIAVKTVPFNPKPGSESEELANVAKRARTVTPVPQSLCQAFAKKAACWAVVALPIITAALLYAGDHYMNGGALSGRFFEQLGLDEEAI